MLKLTCGLKDYKGRTVLINEDDIITVGENVNDLGEYSTVVYSHLGTGNSVSSKGIVETPDEIYEMINQNKASKISNGEA